MSNIITAPNFRGKVALSHSGLALHDLVIISPLAAWFLFVFFVPLCMQCHAYVHLFLFDHLPEFILSRRTQNLYVIFNIPGHTIATLKLAAKDLTKSINKKE